MLNPGIDTTAAPNEDYPLTSLESTRPPYYFMSVEEYHRALLGVEILKDYQRQKDEEISQKFQKLNKARKDDYQDNDHLGPKIELSNSDLQKILFDPKAGLCAVVVKSFNVKAGLLRFLE